MMTDEEATRAILGQLEVKGFRARRNDVNDLGEELAAEWTDFCRDCRDKGLLP